LSQQSITTSACGTSSSSACASAFITSGRTSTSGLMAAIASRCDFGLRLADAFEVVRDLPLQVGEVHGVVVDDRDAADARGAQVQRHGRAEPAGADHQRVGRKQPLLTLHADFIEQDVPR
jgi:hypothetical protein